MTTAEPPGARLALTAGAQDVGHRVVVRRRLPTGGLGDLLGDLLAWDDAVVVVCDRHGEEHAVPRADVVAAKRVPPPATRRTTRRPTP